MSQEPVPLCLALREVAGYYNNPTVYRPETARLMTDAADYIGQLEAENAGLRREIARLKGGRS